MSIELAVPGRKIQRRNLSLDYLAWGGPYQIVTGRTGRALECVFESRKISIEDINNRDYKMRVRVNDYGVALIDVQTVLKVLGVLSMRHPDMCAGDFIRFSLLNYFPSQRVDITSCDEKWYEGSDNWKDYCGLRKIGLSQIVAAKNTWSGRVLGECGFSQVREGSVGIFDTYKRGLKVSAIFEKDRT